MSKHCQGAKKKSRRKAFLEREKKRDAERVRIQKMTDATSIDEIAAVLGIKP